MGQPIIYTVNINLTTQISSSTTIERTTVSIQGNRASSHVDPGKKSQPARLLNTGDRRDGLPDLVIRLHDSAFVPTMSLCWALHQCPPPVSNARVKNAAR
jgi:hypothetical protein